jgi:hypothetical protein
MVTKYSIKLYEFNFSGNLCITYKVVVCFFALVETIDVNEEEKVDG